MLAQSDTDILSKVKLFSDYGLDVAFLVPTYTGYVKSIMDATGPVRSLLKKSGLHDFDIQQQGPENKKIVKSFFVDEDIVQETTCSLYRPVTKQGDPRIWFSGLKHYCIPNNLLGLVSTKETIYVFNLSRIEVIRGIHNGAGSRILTSLKKGFSSVCDELLQKIQEIHSRGFLPAVTHGDTSVGMTLENALDIPPNDSKGPDYKGIELKASRKKISTAMNRVNLYSQTPNWKCSPLRNAHDLLSNWGYIASDTGRFNLYCTVSAHNPNGQGLYFELQKDEEELWVLGQRDNGEIQKAVMWDMSMLRDRLAEKHKETFWVKATSKFEGGKEFFRYDLVVHTKNPLINSLGLLIDQKVVTMDFTIHLKEDGIHTRDHGYLFKIMPGKVDLLFPEPESIHL